VRPDAAALTSQHNMHTRSSSPTSCMVNSTTRSTSMDECSISNPATPTLPEVFFNRELSILIAVLLPAGPQGAEKLPSAYSRVDSGKLLHISGIDLYEV